MISIINVKGLTPNKPGVTYVGREFAGWKGSVLANPYAIGYLGTREQVIEMYKVWLRNQYRYGDAVAGELDKLACRHMNGEDIVLGCWCAPQACHAEFIKQAIEKIADNMAEELNRIQMEQFVRPE